MSDSLDHLTAYSTGYFLVDGKSYDINGNQILKSNQDGQETFLEALWKVTIFIFF